MEMKLIKDTLRMLHRHFDADTTIDLDPDNEQVKELICLINRYQLAYTRKVTVLACCMLIHASIGKHDWLTSNCNVKLTRGILDGDYLTGMMYRIALQRKEWKLAAHLLPFQKRVQLALINGDNKQTIFKALNQSIQTYLDEQCA